jgi:hypothetical protein
MPPAERRGFSRVRQVSQDLSEGEINSILAAQLGFLPSLDHVIRPHEHVGRNRQADLLSRFQIDDEPKLGWLFDRQVCGFGALSILST